MKNPFSGLFRARDKPQDSVSAAPVFYFGTSDSGKSVTVQSAIQLSTVYACYFRETITSLPPETTKEGKEKATTTRCSCCVKELTIYFIRGVTLRSWQNELEGHQEKLSCE